MFRYKAESLKLSLNMGNTYAQVVKNTDAVETQYFPIEIWIIIWKKMFSSTVLKELKHHESVWSPEKKQSKKLKKICSEDVGAIQFGFTDFDKLVDKHGKKECRSIRNYSIIKIDRHIHDLCLNGGCLNCKQYGFPCSNLISIGLSNGHLLTYESLWKIDVANYNYF